MSNYTRLCIAHFSPPLILLPAFTLLAVFSVLHLLSLFLIKKETLQLPVQSIIPLDARVSFHRPRPTKTENSYLNHASRNNKLTVKEGQAYAFE